MKIEIPELCVVALVGTSGCGKSTFARKHFKATEVISSDFCRGVVSDDENDQASTKDAFELLHYIMRKRLELGKVCVVDATNVQPEARKPLVEIAREQNVLAVAIVLDVPEEICIERNSVRPDRDFGPHVVRRQREQLRRGIRNLEREGFRYVFKLKAHEIEDVTIERTKLWTNRKHETGPFDIIGDIHGCYDELAALLAKLGYVSDTADGGIPRHPEGRRAIFLGDLVDRGPKTPDVLKLVMRMVTEGNAMCVPGNHEMKLMRKLKGRDVRITHGLAESLEQLEPEPQEFKDELVRFIDKLVSHYVLDDGKLVVAHAGMNQKLMGRASLKVRDFAMYGETTGETDEYGLPVRYNWAQDYRGTAMVVYGHTPVPEPEWINNTICLDTGCVFGGRLTALRYPEKELVSVKAQHTYYEPAKPFLPDSEAAPSLMQEHRQEDVLDIEDVSGKRLISTALHGNLTIREENAIAALEVMSRFAQDPKWLIYLPPTMSPSETTKQEGLLEHPNEAFEYYRSRGVGYVVCEEKHMGSRAVVVVAKDLDAARKRFGRHQQIIGACYTRTGRKFFNDEKLEQDFLQIVQEAVTRAGWWEEFNTGWVALDCELMPWSAKAQELIRRQFAGVAAASEMSLGAAVNSLALAAARSPDAEPLLERFSTKRDLCLKYRDAYRHYCWDVLSLADIKLAPFHVLATERTVHSDKNHLWHMEKAHQLAAAGDGMIIPTRYKQVDLSDPASTEDGAQWWQEMTSVGGEGMVVKPLDFISRGGPRQSLLQPAVKCRGPEYLRIIYGPEYTLEENLSRLRIRGLGAKRSLALREFALGIEGLQRFVREEPLYRVHECVFAVLAFESEPVDPRL